MALLKDVQSLIPTADTVAGRVIAYHDRKHYDLGEHVGEGVVKLTKEAETLIGKLKGEAKAVEMSATKVDVKPFRIAVPK